MSVFQDIVKLWNSDDLLSQAWDESYKMMVLSNEIFNQARKTIIERLKKDGSEHGGKDGMDASIVCFNRKVILSSMGNY